ncbi:MAG: DEAD/DEAH box helicase [Verrucomicrobiia bacterium]
MEKTKRKNRKSYSGESKYDVNNSIISKAYGEYADLRRELSDSKDKIAERYELLKLFANCTDLQRSWLLLEDYFEKLGVSRKDFIDADWWSKISESTGDRRLQELAFLFIRSRRTIPPELSNYADYARFAEIEKSEKEKTILKDLENWIIPPAGYISQPKSIIKIYGELKQDSDTPIFHSLELEFVIFKSNGTREIKTFRDLMEIAMRPECELEQYSIKDLVFLKWLSENYGAQYDVNARKDIDQKIINGSELYHWLIRWGTEERIESKHNCGYYNFCGEYAVIQPEIIIEKEIPYLWFGLKLPTNEQIPINEAIFISGNPTLCARGNKFYILHKSPPPAFYEYISAKEKIPLRNLTPKLKAYLRRQKNEILLNWEEICIIHPAKPRFVFELESDIIRVKLLAISEKDGSVWLWNGHEWEPQEHPNNSEPPNILDDTRVEEAVKWMRKLDLLETEPGVWTGDVTEGFLFNLAALWELRPKDAEYMGNQAFCRLFISPTYLRPKVVVKGSGIDWLSVSAEWEAEGLKLTKADLEQLANSTGRFVKLPDAGWVELDTEAVIKAHEAAAELGMDGLVPVPEKIPIEQLARTEQQSFLNFSNSEEALQLKERLKTFKGIPEIPIPEGVTASLRPYQKEGFYFLCHLTNLGFGGILADDMGLGKTIQTLTWLLWLKENKGTDFKPALVICPASVLHNWKRESEKFTPQLKVLILESGAARHGLRKKIPHNDLIITSYALLRRDLEELLKFSFSAVILDEAQFIKNPDAQITIAVKQLKAQQRLALTGTPLENRLLDLWSIVDFVQPGYLGSREQFHKTYDPPTSWNSEESLIRVRIARKRLSAKLRPILIRRLKQQVADDLPDRIEERRDCVLVDTQRKLYLAELKRSREQIAQVLTEKGVARSKIHILAALTRLRQICCHPALVGSDAPSGKTETLFELLEPLIAEGHKVLLFSQFVRMLKILEKECAEKKILTYTITGETKERMNVVNSFQEDPNPCVFLLSLRAAGTGLNLTTASYVILYDPWWNPAVEAQAIDRSHRIGQTKTVNAYRLISPGTVEEKIWELQQRKAQTISDVLGEEGFARSLTRDDIEYLFADD